MFDSEVVEVAEHHGSSTSVQIHFLEDVRLMLLFVCLFVFFLSGFSFTSIHDSQDSRGRGGYLFNSSLPLPPASQALRH